MLECRDVIEHQIKWHPKMGSSQFWYDNWTGLGELYFIVTQDFGIDESINNVMNVVEEGGWNVNKLLESLPEEYVSHIVENIKPHVVNDKLDIPYWMLEPRGHFSLKSAWEYLRRSDEPREAYKKICVKRIAIQNLFLHVEGVEGKTPSR